MCLAKWANFFPDNTVHFILFHYPLFPLFFLLFLLISDHTSLWLLVGTTSPSSFICRSTSVQQMLQPTVLCWVEFWHFIEASGSCKWQINPSHEKLSPWKYSDLIFSSVCCGLATCLLFYFSMKTSSYLWWHLSSGQRGGDKMLLLVLLLSSTQMQLNSFFKNFWILPSTGNEKSFVFFKF